jgi:hypothetical protein
MRYSSDARLKYSSVSTTRNIIKMKSKLAIRWYAIPRGTQQQQAIWFFITWKWCTETRL